MNCLYPLHESGIVHLKSSLNSDYAACITNPEPTTLNPESYQGVYSHVHDGTCRKIEKGRGDGEGADAETHRYKASGHVEVLTLGPKP